MTQTIYTIRDNLKQTIAGKEKLLAEYYSDKPHSAEFLDEAVFAARTATIAFVTINIQELKRILQDVEQVIADVEADRKRAGGAALQCGRDNGW